MMTLVETVPEPQHYPMPLARYGLNPYAKPLYRVVFAPSVRHLIGGRWRDGSVEYRSRPTYSNMGNEWVLERWISGEEFAKMSREQYEIRFKNESGLFTMGPYPTEGIYFLCNDAPLHPTAINDVGKLIEAIEFGRRNKSHEREIENGLLWQKEIDQREKVTDDIMLGRIQELRPAFGNRPTSFRGNVHTTKSKVDLSRPAPFKPGGMKVFKEKVNA